jgi:Uma2 family endonuclease
MVGLKVRLLIGGEDIFHCPDLMVVCDPCDTDRHFKRHPRVLIEVLSKTTEHTDRRERFQRSTQIETLEEYVLVAQDRMEVTHSPVQPRQPEVLTTATQALRLASIQLKLPLPAIYEGVKLSARG